MGMPALPSPCSAAARVRAAPLLTSRTRTGGADLGGGGGSAKCGPPIAYHAAPPPSEGTVGRYPYGCSGTSVARSTCHQTIPSAGQGLKSSALNA